MSFGQVAGVLQQTMLHTACQRAESQQNLVKIRGQTVVVDADTVYEPGFLVFLDGMIAAVAEDETGLDVGSQCPVSFEAAVVIPGFVDIHTHGIGGGDEIGSFWLRPEHTLARVVKYGTTALLASMVFPSCDNAAGGDVGAFARFCACRLDASCSCQAFAPRVAGVVERISAKLNAMCGMLGMGAVLEGIHAEGPIVETLGGLPPSDSTMSVGSFKKLLDTLGPALRVMTIAPSVEARSKPKFERLQVLLDRSIRPALGHDTACTVEEVGEALKLAASHGTRLHVTHVFNVQRFHHRNCGLANIALLPELPKLSALSDALPPTVEVIGDCVHVSPLVLKLVATCKPAGAACFITDGIAEPDLGAAMKYCGRTAYVQAKDGQLAVYSTSAEHGNEVLIGSCAMMLDAFKTTVNVLGLGLQRAVDMCCCTPAAVANLSHIGTLRPGKRADVVLLTEKLSVSRVFVGGSVMHEVA